MASLCEIVGHAILAAGPPFPAFVIAGLLNGFGISIQVRLYPPILMHSIVNLEI
jgi:hypothetical protein